jgi:hypothetical protein
MPPRVFLSKSAQAIENKRSECEKERQERKRVRKPLKTKAGRGGQGGRKWESWGYTLGSGKRGVLRVDTSTEPGGRLSHPLLFVK